MAPALSKTRIEAELTTRFGDIFKLNEPRFAEVISTGVPEVDALTRGLPRGAITEIFGPASSGRTSLMLSSLAYATTHDEVCALVDTSDTLDPKTAAQAGVDFDQLLWIRCAASVEHAFKATDLLLQGGGFGLVMLDLGDVPAPQARRIISSWWYRFRRVVENKPTGLVVIAQDSCVRSCASLVLAMSREDDLWTSVSGSPAPDSKLRNQRLKPGFKSSLPGNNLWVPHLLRGLQLQLNRQKPIQLAGRETRFQAKASA
jgi:hypothetical protein